MRCVPALQSLEHQAPEGQQIRGLCAPDRIRTCNLLIYSLPRGACLGPIGTRGFGVKRGERVRAGVAAVSRQCVPNLHWASRSPPPLCPQCGRLVVMAREWVEDMWFARTADGAKTSAPHDGGVEFTIRFRRRARTRRLRVRSYDAARRTHRVARIVPLIQTRSARYGHNSSRLLHVGH
jgi:hypothetical protein